MGSLKTPSYLSVCWGFCPRVTLSLTFPTFWGRFVSVQAFGQCLFEDFHSPRYSKTSKSCSYILLMFGICVKTGTVKHPSCVWTEQTISSDSDHRPSAGVQMVWDCAAVWLHFQLLHFTLVRCEEKEEFIKTFLIKKIKDVEMESDTF